MTDRRRINGPAGGTAPPLYAPYLGKLDNVQRPERTRRANQLRKICNCRQHTSHGAQLTVASLSPQNRSHTFSLRLCIPRARSTNPRRLQDHLHNTAAFISKTHLYRSRPTATSAIRTFFSTTPPLHTCQVRSVRVTTTARIYSRCRGKRSGSTS